jgi:hypothetical protein
MLAQRVFICNSGHNSQRLSRLARRINEEGEQERPGTPAWLPLPEGIPWSIEPDRKAPYSDAHIFKNLQLCTPVRSVETPLFSRFGYETSLPSRIF